jgi:hypothetical protein
MGEMENARFSSEQSAAGNSGNAPRHEISCRDLTAMKYLDIKLMKDVLRAQQLDRFRQDG